MKNHIFCMLILLFITGCASTQKLSLDDRHTLQSVTINPVVTKTDDMYYYGPGVSGLVLLGAVGGAIMGSINKSDGELFREFAESKNISIDKIVYDSVLKSIENSGKIKVTNQPNNNSSTLNISVYQYGFSVPNGFSSELVPILGLQCKLLDSDKKIIWSNKDYITVLGNPVDSIPLTDMKNNPKLIEKSWRIAADHVVKQIFDDL